MLLRCVTYGLICPKKFGLYFDEPFELTPYVGLTARRNNDETMFSLCKDQTIYSEKKLHETILSFEKIWS